jgi:hypothetical protein
MSTKDDAQKAAEAYVDKNVAENDGSYWGWNADDCAMAKAAFLAGAEWERNQWIEWRDSVLRAIAAKLPESDRLQMLIGPRETIYFSQTQTYKFDLTAQNQSSAQPDARDSPRAAEPEE